MDRDNHGTEMLSQNKLIVGNSDSILMFGCEEQQMLREFSKHRIERGGKMSC